MLLLLNKFLEGKLFGNINESTYLRLLVDITKLHSKSLYMLFIPIIQICAMMMESNQDLFNLPFQRPLHGAAA